MPNPLEDLGEGVTVNATTGAAPVQVEGEVDGKCFYFRSRGDNWYFCIADTPDAAIRAEFQQTAFYVECKYGLPQGYPPSHFLASWMPHDVARQLIQTCIQAWRLSQQAVAEQAEKDAQP